MHYDHILDYEGQSGDEVNTSVERRHWVLRGRESQEGSTANQELASAERAKISIHHAPKESLEACSCSNINSSMSYPLSVTSPPRLLPPLETQ